VRLKSRQRIFGAFVACVLLLIPGLLGAAKQGPAIPVPAGFVTDDAGVIGPERKARIIALLTELERRTGVEVAVLTVQSTQPLDDFDYGMEVFDRWKIGKRGKDNGLLFLVVVRDRRVRMITGYGLEGILPDGKIGEITDEEVLPAFHKGRYGLGILRGAWAVARVVANDAHVSLSGTPPPAPKRERPVQIPDYVTFIAVLFFIVMSAIVNALNPYRRRGGWIGGPWMGGGGGFGGGGFGGGGFGGFGGGGSGGGGAGRGW
jgi:uncharacterized protein